MNPESNGHKTLNCLLISPAWPVDVGKVFLPIGICFIAAALKRIGGLKCFTMNLNALEEGEDRHRSEITAAIEREKIDVVLSGGYVVHYKSMAMIFETAKKSDPGIVTVAGGPIITSEPRVAMEILASADMGIIGEGERTITELCGALQAGKPVGGVKGLVIKEGDGSPRLTEAREFITNWTEEIFWPDYEGFGVSEAAGCGGPNSSHKLGSGFFLHTSRGCPFNCTFCNHSQGRVYRERPLDDLIAEIVHLKEYYGDCGFMLSDDLFANSMDRVRRFCAAARRLGLQNWSLSMRVPQINAEIIEELKEGGCSLVSLGLESACDKILKSMNKGITVRQIEEALGLLYERGLPFSGNFIFGDTEETWETFMETMAWWEAHPQYPINLAPIVLFPGSALYAKAVAEGKIADQKEHLINHMPLINVSKMSDEEYKKMLVIIQEKGQARFFGEKSEIHQLWEVETGYDFKGLTKKVRGYCRRCGRHIDIEAELTKMIDFCPFCLQQFTMTDPDLIMKANADTIKMRLEELLREHGRLAFWGIGTRFKNTIAAELSDLPGIYLLDNNPQGRKYGRKTVEDAREAIRHKIKCIVVSVSPMSMICRDIQTAAREMGIENTVNLYQLLDASPPKNGERRNRCD